MSYIFYFWRIYVLVSIIGWRLLTSIDSDVILVRTYSAVKEVIPLLRKGEIFYFRMLNTWHLTKPYPDIIFSLLSSFPVSLPECIWHYWKGRNSIMPMQRKNLTFCGRFINWRKKKNQMFFFFKDTYILRLLVAWPLICSHYVIITQ